MSIAPDPVVSAGPARPGWYDDPAHPGSDRWWTGYQWSDKTAKAPRPSMFPPGYERSMRAGFNTAAKAGVALAMIGFSFCAAIILNDMFEATLPVWAILMLFVVGALFGIASLFVSFVALRRSGRLGALGMSIYSLALGSFVVLMTAGGLVVAFVSFATAQ